ncbi:STAS-like domain-containing protein [Thalassorhabdomicrobium marinisediminis]|uniref:DUF4325 domain-containing protein n=1 Tax=Thalassorhabdomicrobium marinisediminis TaxID=2170577 RepID=A0A2T7FZ68_9RHOB|nr:STAS-like domain-containing protein [Thalassorhabdomicrobium marinisediminis]PVA07452.1 hypothetical protein DC363_06345 [Thalassorhabdomicrobium marinisediminis]
MKTTKVIISTIVDGGICVAASDGQKVYRVIYDIITKGNRAEISFFGVTRMTTAFLNTAVGQLYGELEEGVIRKHLAPPVDYQDWHLARLKMVVERAKVFFADPPAIEKLFEDGRGDADE